MTGFNRIVLMSIAAATCLGVAHADGLKSWTFGFTRVGQGVIEMTSPDGTVTAVTGPSAPQDGRSPTAHLDDFIARQYSSSQALKRGELKTNDGDRINMAWQDISYKDSDGKTKSQMIWVLIQADRPVQFVTIHGRPDTDAEREAVGAILNSANVPVFGQKPATSPARKPPTRTATPPPAALPQVNDIQSIVHSFGRRAYSVQSGLYSYRGEGIWVLFKNGWAYKIPNDSLSDLDLPISKRDASSRWKKISALPKAVKSAAPLPPQQRGARLSLTVSRPDTSGRFGHVTTRTDQLVLDKSGHFETSFYSLTSAAFGAPPAEGHGGAIESDGDAQGTYVIDGYTITLSFDSGKTLQTFFATDPSGDTVLGNTYYWNSTK